jgi:hypothetical protein
MKPLRTLSAVILAAAATIASAGCYGTTEVSGGAYVRSPRLEYISPGVQVVADYDYPVFYSGGAYWRYDSGTWLYSHQPYHGFIRARVVPRAVLSIDRPYAYTHYHVRAMGARRPVRVYRY